jgi:hypothetical protein
MRRARSRWAAILTCALAACSSGSGRQQADRAPATATPEGRYDFIASLPRGEVRGAIFILPDTILVQPENGFCLVSMSAPDQRSIRYDCPGVGDMDSLNLRLDRHNPRAFSKWYAVTKVLRQRQVCVRYVVNDRGQRVCAEVRTETVEEKVRYNGALRIMKPVG